MSDESLDTRLRALLLGDLSPDEERELRALIERDAAARARHEHLRRAMLPILHQPLCEPSDAVMAALLARVKQEQTAAQPPRMTFLQGFARRYGMMTAAASVVAAVAIGIAVFRPWEPAAPIGTGTTLATTVEGRTERLPDGSVLQLGPNTSVELIRHRQLDTLTIKLERGSLLVDAKAFGAQDGNAGQRTISIEAGDHVTALNVAQQPALVSFEYAAPHSTVQERNGTYDVDLQRVRLNEVLALGRRFGVDIDLETPRFGELFVDAQASGLDRDGYIHAVKAVAATLNLEFAADEAPGAQHLRLIERRGSQRPSDLPFDKERLTAVVFGGQANVSGREIRVDSTLTTSDAICVLSRMDGEGAIHVEQADARVCNDAVFSAVVGIGARFDAGSTPDSLVALNRQIAGGSTRPIRMEFKTAMAAGDADNGMFIKMDDGAKMLRRGERVAFGATEGTLVWAGSRGALITTDRGPVLATFTQR